MFKVGVSFLTIITVVMISLAGAAQAAPLAIGAENPTTPQAQIGYLNGSIPPGTTLSPTYPVFGTANQNVNIKMNVPDVAGTNAISVTVTDGSSGTAFQGVIIDGETLWASLTFKPGTNTVTLHNNGATAVTYEIFIYEIPSAPFNWAGASLGNGTWNSFIKLNFPASGLYTFDYGLTSGRYQFLVDDMNVQKTVEANGTVAYYVAAGLHSLKVIQDSDTANTAWTLNTSAVGAANDSLPYTKGGGELGGTGNDFGTEWLPINLTAETPANVSLALTGNANDTFDIAFYAGNAITPFKTVTNVYGGETLWWAVNLPSGTTRVKLMADVANITELTYQLNVQARPTAPATWSGIADNGGNNAEINFTIATAGLYNFNYGLTSGRYQFLINKSATGAHIQKTVEITGTVRYYLPAGNHTLTIVQDTDSPTTQWSLSLASASLPNDTLPYQKQGGNMGGTGNDFTTEWLPIQLAAAGPANFALTINGSLDDSLQAFVYQGSTLVYTSPVAYGGETIWWTGNLTAGSNYVKLTTQKSILAPELRGSSPLKYTLAVNAIPTPPANWDGIAKGSAGNSIVQANITTGGLYHVTLDTPNGFAQVQVDDSAATGLAPLAVTGHTAEFDIQLAAGLHSLQVIQSSSYLTTTWELSLEATTASAEVAHFAGHLSAGVTVKPQLPLPSSAEKKVNFRLQVPANGGSGKIDLAISDGTGKTVFTGSILDGETLWGTTTLKPLQNTFTFTNTSGVALDYDLTIYEIGTAPYDWAGVSRGTGTWNSHVLLNFPTGGLYTFGYGRTQGRYQFLVNDKNVQKTVEENGSVAYYLPAGQHLLTVDQDSNVLTTTWTLNTSAVGAANNSLPYAKNGGNLGGAGNDFDTEWLPLNLAAAAPANFALTLKGATANSMDVYLYAGASATPFYTVTDVYGGETLWWAVDLPAGTTRIKLMTDGNPTSLTYTLNVQARPTAPASWSGAADFDGNNSEVDFTIATAGLYDFNFGLTNGRYQFFVNETASGAYIQKTVEVTGTVRYYLPAGNHTLTIVQETDSSPTEWSVAIAAAGIANDSLPYTKSGGDLGGVIGSLENDFNTEWLPIQLSAHAAANFALTLNGDLGDGLIAYVYQGSELVYTSPIIYGGETFWWQAYLAAGANHVKFVAQNGNIDPLAYELEIVKTPYVVSNTPVHWEGLAKGTGGNSRVMLVLPVTGTYHVTLYYPSGFANIDISQIMGLTSNQPQAANGSIDFDASLPNGDFLFTVLQSNSYVITPWSVTVTLKTAPAPIITSITPVSVTNNVTTTLTINGANFQPGATVAINGTTVINLPGVTWINNTQLQVKLPAGVAAGTYTVIVTNPDSQKASLLNGLQVIKYAPPAPQITSISPISVTNNVTTTLTINGANFQTGATVAISGTTVINLPGVTWINNTQLQVKLPAGVAAGTYTVIVTNPDSQKASLPKGLLVVQYVPKPTVFYVYLPLIRK
jgi:hypothetical protein